MSVRVMAQVWGVDLPAGEKLVLLALADAANDEGKCWPGMGSLSRKAGLSKRHLLRIIQILERAGHISREIKVGVGTNYRIHPKQQLELLTGDTVSPVTKRHQRQMKHSGGDTMSPKPSGTVIPKKDKPSLDKRAFAAPPGVPDDVWADFLKSPNRRKAGMSQTAYNGICNNLTILAEHGFPPGDMIALAVERGWRTVTLEWAQNNQRKQGYERPDTNPTGTALSRVQAALRSGSPVR